MTSADRQKMSFLTSALDLFREAKHTLVTVNRMVADIDPLYVRITWAGAAIGSLRQLGLYTLVGGLFGHVLTSVTVDWTTVSLGIAAYLIYRLAETAITALLGLRAKRFELAMWDTMEERMLTKLASLDLGRLLDPAFIELHTLAQRRGTGSVMRLWQSQLSLVGAAVALGTGSLVLLGLDPIIGVLAVLTAGPMIARDWLVEAKRRDLDEAETLTRRKKYEVENALTSPRAGLRSRLWKLAAPYHAYFRDLARDVRNNALTLARFDRRWNLIVGLIEVVMLAILCGYFASALVGGKFTYLQLGAIGGSLSMLVSGVHGFGSSLSAIEHEHLDYGYLSRMLETRPLVDESRAKDVALVDTPKLTVEDVSFAYPSTSIPVLVGCSLTVRPGEKVALVGRNGSGKTTLLRLITKVYVPQQGSIRIDDRDLTTIRQQSWLGHVLMATQDLELPGMEAARALTGLVAEEIDSDRMRLALLYSGADDVVAALPDGMRTWIGEQWPGGRGFSTGQMQRLALAGAFYRFLDPQVFVGIFDEPMANCDVETRTRFYQSIRKATEFDRKTILMSLHDPLYLQYFDRVLLLEGGTVAKDLRGHAEIVAYRERIAMTLAADL
jgi:ABC-type multidrug transport system fused ATPase/permease subunit